MNSRHCHRKFIGLVVADANSEERLPDGAARQVLAEYGDFPANRDLRAAPRRRTSSSLRVKAGHANANAP